MLPKKDVQIGKRTLACIGVQYKDLKRHVSASSAKSMGNAISSFAERNSRGLLKIDSDGFSHKVPFNAAKKNANEAINFVKKLHKGYDFYAVCNIYEGPRAARDTAYLPGDLKSTAIHEVFHLIGTGHAGMMKLSKGKLVLDMYGDNMSIMSRYPSNTLTSPQYYHLGWTQQNEVAVVYEKDMKVPGTLKTFTVSRLNNERKDTLTTVIYASGNPRACFISFPQAFDKPGVAMHLSSGGSSQLIKRVMNDYHDDHFTGLEIKILNFNKETNQVTFSMELKDSNVSMTNAFKEGEFEDMEETEMDLGAESGEDLEFDEDINTIDVEDSPEEPEEKPPKKNIFSRLFSKKNN